MKGLDSSAGCLMALSGVTAVVLWERWLRPWLFTRRQAAGHSEAVEQLKLGPLCKDTSRPGLAELQLQRPLISFDLETTGFCRAGEYIVEIAAIKLFPDGHQEQLSTLVKPPKSIPPAATKVHGITDTACADAPSFAALAQQLHAFFDGSDLAGHNIVAFDVPFLAMEFKTCGIEFPAVGTRQLDTLLVCRAHPAGNTLAEAMMRFCGKQIVSAHRALGDADASLQVALAQACTFGGLAEDWRCVSDAKQAAQLQQAAKGRKAKAPRAEVRARGGDAERAAPASDRGTTSGATSPPVEALSTGPDSTQPEPPAPQPKGQVNNGAAVSAGDASQAHSAGSVTGEPSPVRQLSVKQCFSTRNDGTVVLGFTKHRGMTLKAAAEKEPGLLQWMLTKDFISDDAKVMAAAALALAGSAANSSSGNFSHQCGPNQSTNSC